MNSEKGKKTRDHSRAIVIIGVLSLLLAGGWVIAKRVAPYVSEQMASVSPIQGPPEALVDDVVEEDSLLAAGNFAVEAGTEVASLPVKNSRKTIATVSEVGVHAPAESDSAVIKTGSLSLVVSNIDQAAEKIREETLSRGGSVHSSNFGLDRRERKRGWLTVRVPSDRFREALEAFKALAVQVVSENTSSVDVSEEFVDLRARLENKKREEESIVKILEKSDKISDVLAVTRELSRVRGEIERLEGRIRYLSERTSFATITVSLTEDEKISGHSAWRPGAVFKKAVDDLIVKVQKTVNVVIIFSAQFIPLFLLYALGLVLLWRLVRKMIAFVVQRLPKDE